jgi:CubicO group peptidase (beta-lactamase class C family)
MTKVPASIPHIERFDAIIEPMMRAARIPGIAIAVVAGNEMWLARAYGHRDLESRLALATDTLYPIASTTKSMTATLLGMLVDEGLLDWDVPVQTWLPRFWLSDPFVSTQVTIRDLLLMRTGLPRHDWMWGHRAIGRAELVERMHYLELSAGFRERFQYNNLTVTAAAHAAEAVTGQNWETSIQERLLNPLRMSSSQTGMPLSRRVTRGYHDTAARKIALSALTTSQATAPSGGALFSTVEDMARWVLFNLNGGNVEGRQLVDPETFAEICAPGIGIGADESRVSPGAMRALGWTVDRYNGHARVSHGGLLADVSSDVTLYPQLNMGFASFLNLASPLRAKLINQYLFDAIMGLEPKQTWKAELARYENAVEVTHHRNSAMRRHVGTAPSHSLAQYVGRYSHPGYGEIEIQLRAGELNFRLNDLTLPLDHWHYDFWVVQDTSRFPIHIAHEFDQANPLSFQTDADGKIAAISVRLESAVGAIRFGKQ